MNAKQLIAQLIDERKITGEEAIILFEAVKDVKDSNWSYNPEKYSFTKSTEKESDVKFFNNQWVRDLGNGITQSI